MLGFQGILQGQDLVSSNNSKGHYSRVLYPGGRGNRVPPPFICPTLIWSGGPPPAVCPRWGEVISGGTRLRL